METGGGGRTQGEGVKDTVKRHIRKVGGEQGGRVMGVNQSPQGQSPTRPGKLQICIQISALKLTGCVI